MVEMLTGLNGYLVGGAAIVLIVLAALGKALNAGKAIQRAEEADSLEEHLKEIGDANVARNSVDSRVQTTTPTGATKAVCSIFPPITYSKADTAETITQVRRHNAGYDSYCK